MFARLVTQVLGCLVSLVLVQATEAATLEVKTGPLMRIDLPGEFEIFRHETSEGESLDAYRKDSPSRRLEIKPLSADVGWPSFAKQDKEKLSAADLQVFAGSQNNYLQSWARSPNVECRRFGNRLTLWRTKSGAIKVMRAFPDGKRGCANVTGYDVIVLLPPVNKISAQVTFSASEEGFKNAWNEDSKTATLQQMEEELARILKQAAWR